MAVTLDRLVERGWVERVRSTADRRAMQIHLTPAGDDLVERAEKIAATMEAPALRALSAAERALLIELLMIRSDTDSLYLRELAKRHLGDVDSGSS